MKENALQPVKLSNQILMPDHPNKDQQSRIQRFIDWLDMMNLTWHSIPSLQPYCYYLQRNGKIRGDERGLAPATINAHLSEKPNPTLGNVHLYDSCYSERFASKLNQK